MPLTGYTYEDLSAAVRQSAKVGPSGDPIADRVLGVDVTDEDRVAFIDGVSSSLELGNFLLLLVGDGIRSGVQQIAGLLQNRATLGFSFGLIEMALYGGKDGKSYYLQPRTLAQTVKIERTVFLTGAAGKEAKISKVDAGGRPQTISEQEFFDSLGKVDPALPARLRGFLDKCRAVGCDPQLRRRYILYVEDPNGERMNLGVVYREGRVEIWGMAARDEQLSQPVGLDYMRQISSFVPGASVKDDADKRSQWHVRFEGRSSIPLDLMLQHEQEWLDAIQRVLDHFRAMERTV